MNYKDVRDKFVEISGRYDLITATNEDNGADFFLNAGQKYLDRFLDAGKAIARSLPTHPYKHIDRTQKGEQK